MRFFSVPMWKLWLVEQRKRRGIDRGRIDQRLVALNVDDQIGGFGGRHFGHAVGSREMIGARHPHRCRRNCRAAS